MLEIVSSQSDEINISSLTLEEKIAQMFIVRGDKFDSHFLDIGVGGIFLTKQKTEKDYQELIKKYQESSKIKLLVLTDMEGYWNPFPFFKSKSFSDIKTKEEAYQLGQEHGKILKKLNFTINFSPVVEAKNKVWLGRSFIGTNEEIKQKIIFYVTGLQEQGILATAKHYPGGNMLKNPHWFKVKANISEEDLSFFETAIQNNVSAVMIGHAIVSGAIDSKKKQSTVSKEVISTLRKNFTGIVITDAISMWGLRFSYLFNTKKLYIDLVKAGNDIILDIPMQGDSTNYKKVKLGIQAISSAVKKGEISEKQIDESVKRILQAKGYEVIS